MKIQKKQLIKLTLTRSELRDLQLALKTIKLESAFSIYNDLAMIDACCLISDILAIEVSF